LLEQGFVNALRNQPTLDADAESRRVGQTIAGKWQLERLLGSGAAGAVYAARHKNGHRVAIKVVRSKWAAFPEMRERFLNEARASNRVEHRAVARVHDEGIAEDGSVFLVMDLLQGQTLDEYLQANGPLTVEQALLLAHEMLDVLEVSHSAGVLHRDIKPANLFLNWDGRILLLDFGVARLSESRFLTQVGVPVGTPSFMPPEQAAGRWSEVDARSDLWSLAATLFTLLCGQTVRQAATIADELQAAVDGTVRSLAAVGQFPKEVVTLVDRALATDPSARFDGAASMRWAVRHAMSALGIRLPSGAELPGHRAGFAPEPHTTPANDQFPSAIRLKADMPTSATTEDGVADAHGWADEVKGWRRSRIGSVLFLLLFCAAGFVVWQPSLRLAPVSHLLSEVGVLQMTRAAVPVVDPDRMLTPRVQEHALALREGSIAIQEALRSAPRAATAPRAGRAPSRSARSRFRPAPSIRLVPPTVVPEPFDPLAARL
jgi:serine/threonine-protein kinase